MPGISRTLLAQRLRHLERRGVLETWPSPTGRGSEYHLTPAGKDLEPVLEAHGPVVGRVALRGLRRRRRGRPPSCGGCTAAWPRTACRRGGWSSSSTTPRPWPSRSGWCSTGASRRCACSTPAPTPTSWCACRRPPWPGLQRRRALVGRRGERRPGGRGPAGARQEAAHLVPVEPVGRRRPEPRPARWPAARDGWRRPPSGPSMLVSSPKLRPTSTSRPSASSSGGTTPGTSMRTLSWRSCSRR